MAINFFNTATVADGTAVTSTVNISELVSAIQTKGADPYFDTTSEIGMVFVYYTHEDGRQEKKVVHNSSTHEGTVQWSTNARDGTWAKSRIKAFDKDGALAYLERSDIGTTEDLTHQFGVTNLNIS
jgi:hypothetical protein